MNRIVKTNYGIFDFYVNSNLTVNTLWLSTTHTYISSSTKKYIGTSFTLRDNGAQGGNVATFIISPLIPGSDTAGLYHKEVTLKVGQTYRFNDVELAAMLGGGSVWIRSMTSDARADVNIGPSIQINDYYVIE